MIVVLIGFTLLAFAANSLLCRMALDGHLIDPMSFTTLRLVSGALALIPISRLVAERKTPQETKGSWSSGFALFAYAAAFSLAYVWLSTGIQEEKNQQIADVVDLVPHVHSNSKFRVVVGEGKVWLSSQQVLTIR